MSPLVRLFPPPTLEGWIGALSCRPMTHTVQVPNSSCLTLLSQRPVIDAPGRIALVQRIDWKRFLSLTTSSLHPFLHLVLNDNGMLDFIPHEALAVLERAKTDAVIRCMRRKAELQRVFTLLNDKGIEAVVLKGASLCELVYPEPYLRPMRDVDLWIPEPQMRRAQSLLEANGYREKHVRGLEKDPRDGKEIRLAKFFKHDLSVIEIHSTLDIHLPADMQYRCNLESARENPGLRADLGPRHASPPLHAPGDAASV